jgi:hypothetical protein
MGIGVGGVAQREQGPLTEPTLAAGNREGHHHPVANFKLCDLPADFDDAHGLMAQNVTFFHGGHQPVVEVQVGAADGRGGDLNDGVGGIDEFGVGHGLDPHVFFAVPAECFHVMALLLRFACFGFRLSMRLHQRPLGR